MEREFDQERAEAAVRELLTTVGEDPDREGLKETPTRVARAYREVFAGLFEDSSEMLAKIFNEDHQELILIKDIPIYSTCEHHLVPFFGVVHIGYTPGKDDRATRLSKLARLVDGYAKCPQMQERLTSQATDALVERLDPASAIVIIEAEHLYMTMRDIRKPGARMMTSAIRGGFKTDARLRVEAMALIRRS